MSPRTAPWMPAPVSCAINRCCHGATVPILPTTGAFASTNTGVDIAMNARSTAIERFDVRITNNSDYRMDAAEASVLLSYGADGRAGKSIYVEDEQDLSGVIAKGHSKTGTYSFEVPVKGMGEMLVEVSPSFDRDPALFSMSVG